MPIYEYRCENGHQFEVIQRFTDDPVSECQTCSEPVEKVFHPVAVHFKGSGFYNTDYGTRKRSREAKESSSSASDVKSASDSGSSGSSTADAPKADTGKDKTKPSSSTSSKASSSSSAG